MESRLKLESRLNDLVGLDVKESSSGGAAGSILIIYFSNEAHLYVDCIWRISQNEKVTVTSSDTFKYPDGLIIKESRKFLGKVIDFSLSQFYDLTLTLDTGYKIELFCDIGPSSDDYLNWGLNIPQENLSLEIDNHLQVLQSKYYGDTEEDDFKPNFNLLDDLN